MSKTVPCPQCRQPAVLDPANRFRPFCSERCKLLDLGEWFAGRYTIPAVEADDDGTTSGNQEPERLQ
ncbi:MAG: DNA gyrase inhibitor YacG [Panacagrimonas sp.]